MFKYLRIVFLNVWRVVYSYFAWVLKYSKHPERYPMEVRFAKVQKLIRKVLATFPVDFKTYNVESIQRKEGDLPRLIVSNHLSDLDPLIFIALAERPISFVAKKEAEKAPMVGRIIKILDGVFMDRNDLKQSLRVMKVVENKLKNIDGYDYVIFPEGTRNKSEVDDAAPFHHGSFRPGVKADADILIFGLNGTKRVLNRHVSCKKYPVEIKYIDKFTSDDYKKTTTPELAEKAHDMVVEEVKKLREVDKELIKELN